MLHYYYTTLTYFRLVYFSAVLYTAINLVDHKKIDKFFLNENHLRSWTRLVLRSFVFLISQFVLVDLGVPESGWCVASEQVLGDGGGGDLFPTNLQVPTLPGSDTTY